MVEPEEPDLRGVFEELEAELRTLRELAQPA